jgi:hypothetical protein
MSCKEPNDPLQVLAPGRAVAVRLLAKRCAVCVLGMIWPLLSSFANPIFSAPAMAIGLAATCLAGIALACLRRSPPFALSCYDPTCDVLWASGRSCRERDGLDAPGHPRPKAGLLAAQSGWACPGAHLLAQRERLLCPNHLARGV